LEHGVTVTGRLIKDGTPLPNIEVGINQTNNLAETNLGEIVAKTNQEGRFVLKDVAANDEYEVYGKRDSLGILGIPGRKVIKTGEAGSTVSVGDILVAPGRKIAGRIVLSDGNRQALPPSVQLHVSRLPGTADYQYINLGSDLKFELMVRDQERMVLDAYIPGYEIPHQEGQFGKAIDVTPDLEAIDLVFVPK
jgi:hypothetical protein